MDYQQDRKSLTNAKRLSNTEIDQLFDEKKTEINETLKEIADNLTNFPMLRNQYTILTRQSELEAVQQKAAYELGNVPDGLKLASANYLIEALQFWLSVNMYGWVGASIASALGRLGKRKAIPILTQLFLAQADQTDVRSVVERALYQLSCEEPI
jgi:hypothetical protein